MFAVIRTGGKQYKVAKDDVIFVEKLGGETGSEILFDEVLMIGDGGNRTFGTPTVAGAAVTATVLEQARASKILVFKKRRRKGYRRKRGHRQNLTVLRITDIRAVAEAKEATRQQAKPVAEEKADAAPETAAPPPAAKAKKTATKRAPAKKAEGAAAEAPAVTKAKAAAKPAAKKARARKPAAKDAADPPKED